HLGDDLREVALPSRPLAILEVRTNRTDQEGCAQPVVEAEALFDGLDGAYNLADPRSVTAPSKFERVLVPNEAVQSLPQLQITERPALLHEAMEHLILCHERRIQPEVDPVRLEVLQRTQDAQVLLKFLR